MKTTNEQVRQAIHTFINQAINICFTAIVADNSMAESDGYVVATYDDLDYKVKLQAVTNATGKGWIQVPKVGSQIFCVCEGNSPNRYVAAAYTDVEKVVFKQDVVGTDENGNSKKVENSIAIDKDSITLKRDNFSIALNNDGIVLNGGELKGLVKLDALVKNLKSIKSYVEDMHSAIQTGIEGVGEKTAASGTTGKGLYVTAMTNKKIEFDDMENKKITQ